MCVSGFGFQFHTPSKKENILSEKKKIGGEKSEISQISVFFKKSTLDFKDAIFRLSNHFGVYFNCK